MGIAVMLTAYKRTHLLDQQIAAIEKQTVPPESIFVWNGSGGRLRLPNGVQECSVACCNLGVWPRFMAAGTLPTETVAVFDDDTIPGPRWFENCMNTAKVTGPAVLGACGVSFVGGNRQDRTYPGWKTPAPHIVECDLVGHAWFMPTSVLSNWEGAPHLEYPYCGEDYWISVHAQRMGMKTYAVAHPPQDKTWWGSLEGGLGTDEHALWTQPGAEAEKQKVHDYYLSIGWQPQAIKFDDQGNLIASAKAATWVM